MHDFSQNKQRNLLLVFTASFILYTLIHYFIYWKSNVYFILGFISHTCHVPDVHQAIQKPPKDSYSRPQTICFFPEAFLVFKLLFSSLCPISLLKPHIYCNDSSWGSAGKTNLLMLLFTKARRNKLLDPILYVCTFCFKANES